MLDRTLWQINQERHRHLLRVAEDHRLVKLASGQPSQRERFFVHLGDFLITFGTKLKARYEPAVQLNTFDPIEALQGVASNSPCHPGEPAHVPPSSRVCARVQGRFYANHVKGGSRC